MPHYIILVVAKMDQLLSDASEKLGDNSLRTVFRSEWQARSMVVGSPWDGLCAFGRQTFMLVASGSCIYLHAIRVHSQRIQLAGGYVCLFVHVSAFVHFHTPMASHTLHDGRPHSTMASNWLHSSSYWCKGVRCPNRRSLSTDCCLYDAKTRVSSTPEWPWRLQNFGHSLSVCVVETDCTPCFTLTVACTQINLGVLITRISELLLLLTYCAAPERNCAAALAELQDEILMIHKAQSSPKKPHLGYLTTLADAFGVMKGKRLFRLAKPDMEIMLDTLRENFVQVPEPDMWEVRYVLRRVQNAAAREMPILVRALEALHRSTDIVTRAIKVPSPWQLTLRHTHVYSHMDVGRMIVDTLHECLQGVRKEISEQMKVMRGRLMRETWDLTGTVLTQVDFESLESSVIMVRIY